MSIASELTDLAANKAAIKAAITAQNPSVMPTDALSQWPTSIASIGGGGHEGWIYGYVIDESDPDPVARVAYIEDNAEFSQLYMDFVNGQLVWGSWKSWVEEYFRPAMLRSDGTIDYYLDPDDLTKKADGTASDVSNTSYDGNAMLIVKPIFYNISRIGPKQIRVRFSNVKRDADWFCWTHLRSDGTYADFCGWPLFEGAIVSSKLRSLKGLTPNAVNLALSAQYPKAAANGSNWHMTTYADEMMIRLLFPLLCKTTDSTSSIGVWLPAIQNTGLLSGKGYFWGVDSNSGSLCGQKFLGMENLWGSLWRRCAGAVNVRGALRIKLTPSAIDGTSITSFVASGTESNYAAYLKVPYETASASGTNITKMSVDPLTAFIPSDAEGSTYTTHYCDYLWWTRDTGGTVYGVAFGGGSHGDYDGKQGIFAVGANLEAELAYSVYNASLSYHFF